MTNQVQAVRYTPHHPATRQPGVGHAVFFRPSREYGTAYNTTPASRDRLLRATTPAQDWECNPPPVLPYNCRLRSVGKYGARSWNPDIPGAFIWCRFCR